MFQSDRFTAQQGYRITVEVPPGEDPAILDAIRAADPLSWGDYDAVSFQTAPGQQNFRALGTGRNPATEDVVAVPCLALTFFTIAPVRVIEAIYAVHPYEEPVIYAAAVIRTQHIRGLDEDNPNRFWNRETPDWVPDAHR